MNDRYSSASNTIQALFDTRKSNSESSPHIHCPQCGTPMTIRTPGGVTPVLSRHSRNALSLHLSHFRYGWLKTIADALNQVNLSVSQRAPLRDTTTDTNRLRMVLGNDFNEAEEWHILAEGTLRTKEHERLAKLISQFSPGDIRHQLHANIAPLWKVLPSESDPDPESLEAVVRYVLIPIEKSELFAATLSVVTDEPRFSSWTIEFKRQLLNENQNDSATVADEVSYEALISSLMRDCPEQVQVLMEYLRIIGIALDKKDYQLPESLNDLLETGNNGHSKTLRDRIAIRCERAAFLITLMYLHMTDNGISKLRQFFFTRGRAPTGNGEYQLPEVTPISFEGMKRLLQSVEVSKLDVLQLHQTHEDALAELRDPPSSQQPEDIADGTVAITIDENHEWFINKLEAGSVRKLFSKSFGFACQGRPARLLTFETSIENAGEDGTSTEVTGGEELTDLEGICGWCPKNEQTFGVLLLGSPGSGKSNAFLSGAVALAPSMKGKKGFTSLPTPATQMQIAHLRHAFHKHLEPLRTKQTVYHSLEFTLAKERESSRKIHFVYSDIAGEIATQPLLEGSASPVMRQTLAHADVVVVFFDLSIDPAFASRIATCPNRARLAALIDERERVRRGRPNDDHGAFDGNVADVDQFQFLESIIATCAEERSEQNTMPKLIVVIPKSDLYADPNSNGQSDSGEGFHLMQDVFDHAIQKGVMYSRSTGNNEEDQKLKWKTTTGVSSNNQNETDPIRAQIIATNEIVEAISLKCKDALKKFGDFLKDEATAESREATVWNKSIEDTISRLENIFPSVVFLPTSAMGAPKSDSKDNNLELQRKLGRPQKFCEFLFITPMMMLADQLKDDLATQPPQDSTDRPDGPAGRFSRFGRR